LLHDLSGAFGFEGYDSCADTSVAPALVALADAPAIADVLRYEPIPEPRSPPVPRVRAEEGFFFGGAAGIGSTYMPVETAAAASLRATIRVGFGAAGIVNDPINAQAFVDGGFVGEYLAQQHAYSITGYTLRVRAPGYVTLADGAIAVLLAKALKDTCPFCVNWAAAAAGGGILRIWKTRPLFDPVSWQVSALRDVTLNIFHDEPGDGLYRTEILAPVLTARSVLPIAGGDAWSQSTDIYVDVGPSLAWSYFHPKMFAGGFVSLSASTRLFP
jgi:hypothetical protein